jgi:hypothetical protein
MRLGRSALSLLLQKNVVELRFRRRIRKPGFQDHRRMLCTNDMLLLKSALGTSILNYKPPSGAGLKYNPAAKNLVQTWDIFLQDYRMINCDEVEVIAIIQSTPADKFWQYFNESIMPMTSQRKAQIINT